MLADLGVNFRLFPLRIFCLLMAIVYRLLWVLNWSCTPHAISSITRLVPSLLAADSIKEHGSIVAHASK